MVGDDYNNAFFKLKREAGILKYFAQRCGAYDIMRSGDRKNLQ